MAAHETADVVIIGGGVNGLATAIELKELGVDKVVLLERHLIGAGQSGRAAGVLRALVPHTRVAGWQVQSQQFLLAFPERYGFPVPIYKPGYLLVATADDTHLLRFELVARGEEDGLLRGDGVASTLKMAEEVELSGTDGYFMRCDRIDFPPGGIAWHHTHVGPGVRCLLKGELQVETAGLTHELRPFDPWFEAGPDIVLATASKEIESAFVRGMVLPRDILGQSSVRYRDPEQKDKPVPLGRTNFRDELIAI